MEKETKPKRYVIGKGKSLHFPGFPYAVTEEMLNAPRGAMCIRHIQNYEAERGVKILGTLITLK